MFDSYLQDSALDTFFPGLTQQLLAPPPHPLLEDPFLRLPLFLVQRHTAKMMMVMRLRSANAPRPMIK